MHKYLSIHNHIWGSFLQLIDLSCVRSWQFLPTPPPWVLGIEDYVPVAILIPILIAVIPILIAVGGGAGAEGVLRLYQPVRIWISKHGAYFIRPSCRFFLNVRVRPLRHVVEPIGQGGGSHAEHWKVSGGLLSAHAE